LDVIKEEILLCRKATNCERIAIAGGEPLLYPHLTEVVDFISKQGMKPVLMTNGERLTREYAQELKKAGLAQFYFHVDSGQNRPGWEGKDEAAMNELRQHYANMISDLKGVGCGYNITISRENLDSVPEIVRWALDNIDRVQSLSLIALRGMLVSEGAEFRVEDKFVDIGRIQCRSDSENEYNITSDEMFELIHQKNPGIRPCAFLNGTADSSTNKFLVIIPIGRRKQFYGVCGPRTVELFQVRQHLLTGSYTSLVRTPRPSKIVFLASILDPAVRQAFRNFLKSWARDPFLLFKKISLQCINLVQPTEMMGDEKNFCDGCINLIPWKGKMVHSCVLDEYRIFGAPIKPAAKRP
jgi:hypothetical protein